MIRIALCDDNKEDMFSIFCEAHRFIHCDKASSKIIED